MKKLTSLIILSVFMAASLFAGSDAVIIPGHQYYQIAQQTGVFEATFDVMVSDSNCNAAVGFSKDSVTGWSNYSCILRFNWEQERAGAPTSDIDGYIGNGTGGGGYGITSGDTIVYGNNEVYHVRFAINIPDTTYSVYVTPDGGTEVAVVEDVYFRNLVDTLNYITVRSQDLLGGQGNGYMTISNISLDQVIAGHVHVPIEPETGKFEATFNVSVTDSNCNAAIGFAEDSVGSWGDFSAILRFNREAERGNAVESYVDAYVGNGTGGGGYGITSGDTIIYAPDTVYAVRMVVNVYRKVYDVYVTPPGGTEMTIVKGVNFRKQVDELNYIVVRNQGVLNNIGNGNMVLENVPTLVEATEGFEAIALGDLTGNHIVEFDVMLTDSNANIGIGLTTVEEPNWGNFSTVLRFNWEQERAGYPISYVDGYIGDGTGGGGYGITGDTLVYAPDSLYHVKYCLNIPDSMYSVYVTPDGGAQVAVVENVYFRSLQDTLTHLVVRNQGLIGGQGNGFALVSTPVVTEDSTAIDDIASSAIPKAYELSQNYPNPFNPTTNIQYRVAQTGQIRLAIYNVLGQQVRMLVNEEQAAGNYTLEWDGRDATGNLCASGIYVLRMEAKDFHQSFKMLLAK